MSKGIVAAGLVLLSSLSFACTATPAGQDLLASQSGTVPPDPTPDPTPDPLPCADIARTCDRGERQYATVTACTSAGEDRCRLVSTCSASFYCGARDAQCLAVPSCDPGDAQVTSCARGDTCYQRSICGTTITCREPRIDCEAFPTCDAGDVQVTDVDQCKFADCYSRTICGTTIWCVNN